MKNREKKILVLYANSAPIMRESVEAMLYSFRHYLPAYRVYYHNSILNRLPLLASFRKADIIIFHHSITTVWNRKKYIKKLSVLKCADLSGSVKVALFQDEYKNVDLLRRFILDLKIDRAFTLAPSSEWQRIYGEQVLEKSILKQYLSGYIKSNLKRSRKNRRHIDIGYRADWTPMHVKLGKTGLLKRDVATVFNDLSTDSSLSFDIKVGPSGFLNGDNWSKFLRSCRYVLGAPSGSSVLDKQGGIEAALQHAIKNRSEISLDCLYQEHVAEFENSLDLEVLSPRHLEAIENGCAQILIEGSYNGILKPWVHYLPLKRDFSNVDQILDLLPDEEFRNKIVTNCKNDILDNQHYTYKSFVTNVIGESGDTKTNPELGTKTAIVINKITESTKKNLIVCLHATRSIRNKLKRSFTKQFPAQLP